MVYIQSLPYMALDHDDGDDDDDDDDDVGIYLHQQQMLQDTQLST